MGAVQTANESWERDVIAATRGSGDSDRQPKPIAAPTAAAATAMAAVGQWRDRGDKVICDAPS